jgi:hypothetical protein
LTDDTAKRLTFGTLDDVGRCFELESQFARRFRILHPKWIVDPALAPEEALIRTWNGLTEEASKMHRPLEAITSGGRFSPEMIAHGRRLIEELGPRLYS